MRLAAAGWRRGAGDSSDARASECPSARGPTPRAVRPRALAGSAPMTGENPAAGWMDGLPIPRSRGSYPAPGIPRSPALPPFATFPYFPARIRRIPCMEDTSSSTAISSLHW